MPRASKKDEKIDLAIKDTRFYLDEANIKLHMIKREITVLEGRLNSLEIIKNQK